MENRLYEEIDRVKAENERLREALNFIIGTAETIEDAEKVASKALGMDYEMIILQTEEGKI